MRELQTVVENIPFCVLLDLKNIYINNDDPKLLCTHFIYLTTTF